MGPCRPCRAAPARLAQGLRHGGRRRVPERKGRGMGSRLVGLAGDMGISPPPLSEGGIISPMDWTLEVIIVPVSDIDRAVAFYRDQVGFHLDHDTKNEHMHVVQLTPTGSGCSIVFGDLPAQRALAPGTMKG